MTARRLRPAPSAFATGRRLRVLFRSTRSAGGAEHLLASTCGCCLGSGSTRGRSRERLQPGGGDHQGSASRFATRSTGSERTAYHRVVAAVAETVSTSHTQLEFQHPRYDRGGAIGDSDTYHPPGSTGCLDRDAVRFA
jgi:hypothetical protein